MPSCKNRNLHSCPSSPRRRVAGHDPSQGRDWPSLQPLVEFSCGRTVLDVIALLCTVCAIVSTCEKIANVAQALALQPNFHRGSFVRAALVALRKKALSSTTTPGPHHKCMHAPRWTESLPVVKLRPVRSTERAAKVCSSATLVSHEKLNPQPS